jgi:hypothetical protein
MERWATWDGIHSRNVGVYNSAEEAQAEADRRNADRGTSKTFRTSFFLVGDGTTGYESLGPVTRTSYGQ